MDKMQASNESLQVRNESLQESLQVRNESLQESLQVRNEIFQLELKKLDTDNQKKKDEIQDLIDAKKGATARSLSRPSELNDGAVARLKKQTVAEQGSSLPWLT